VECCARSRGCLRWRQREVGAVERVRQLVGDGAKGGDRLLGGRLPRHPLGGARLRGGGHSRQGASRPAAPHLSLSRRGRCAAVSSVRRRLISLARARSRLLFRRLKSEKSSSWSAVPLVKERSFRVDFVGFESCCCTYVRSSLALTSVCVSLV
jgi:hypothetical protein